MQNLNGRVLALLTQRGISARDYVLRDDAADKRVYLASWNTATLGPLPTIAELAAIAPADIAVQEKQATLDKESVSDFARAMLLFYLRDKLQRTPTGAERTAAMAAFKQAYKDVT